MYSWLKDRSPNTWIRHNKNVFCTHLNSGFWKVDFKGYFFPHKDIWVSGLLEQGLKNVELGPSEGGSLAALFLGLPAEDM